MSFFEDTTFNDLANDHLTIQLSQQNPVVMVLNGSELGKRCLLNDASSVIGRNPETTNPLTDRAISSGTIIKKKGTACGYGGDEFMAYLRKISFTQAEVVGESIRQRIASHNFTLNGHSASPTISIGVAELSHEVESPSELIKIADEALYRAKQAGRDKVSR